MAHLEDLIAALEAESIAVASELGVLREKGMLGDPPARERLKSLAQQPARLDALSASLAQIVMDATAVAEEPAPVVELAESVPEPVAEAPKKAKKAS